MAVKNEHIQIKNHPYLPGWEFLCTGCNEKQHVPSRISIDMFLKISKQFQKEHKKCGGQSRETA